MTVLVGLAVGMAVLAMGVRVPRHVVVHAGRRPHGRPVGAAAMELSGVLGSAAAQLRAGASAGEAWSRALGEPVGRVPSVAQMVGRTTTRRRSRAAHGQRAAAVVAASRLSDDLGAPLAGVLDRMALGMAADEECEGERLAALAGPRATAQVLAWLPLLGLVLGVELGANPVAVVLGGGVGTAAAGAGLVLVALGRWWTSALLVRAARDDDVSARRRATGDGSRLGRLIGDRSRSSPLLGEGSGWAG